MKYKLVVREGTRSMEEAVNEMLKEGWELQGGVSVSRLNNYNEMYCQAMIKRNEFKVNVKDNIGSDFEALAALFNEYN